MGIRRPTTSFDDAHRALAVLRDRLPRLTHALGLTDRLDLAGWRSALDRKLLPRFSSDFPLIVAIAGGGSAGKSTLFNSLLGASHSLVKSKAGTSRRVLIAAHPDALARPEILTELFQPFGAVPQPLESPEELATPGDPRYVLSDRLPPTMILLDTPDFDVGGGEIYENRDTAKPALEACDVLVYLFTNATYHNLSNGNFIREVAASVGRRQSVLVYRAYESYDRAEIVEHATEVARKLYGDDYERYVLGVYRADDTNRVAAGEEPTRPRPVDGEPPLLELLGQLDPRAVRRAHVQTLFADVVQQARDAAAQCRLSRDELQLYADALRVAQSHAVKSALSSLPLEEVTLRVRRIWEETSPPTVRSLRAVSKTLGLPFVAAMRGVRWVQEKVDQESAPKKTENTLRPRLNDLEDAANELYRTALVEEIDSSTTRDDPNGKRILELIRAIRATRRLEAGEIPRAEASDRGAYNFFVPTHPLTRAARQELSSQPWKPLLDAILAEAGPALRVPEKSEIPLDRELDRALTEVVARFREEMPLWNRIRETGFATLHLLPPLGAVTWVLFTGDAAGASAVATAQTGLGAALAAKVTGLFGLSDLWALVALPAGAGLSKADREQLAHLLQPIIQQWFLSRSAAVQACLERHITAPLLGASAEAIDEAERLLEEIDAQFPILQQVEHAYADG